MIPALIAFYLLMAGCFFTLTAIHAFRPSIWRRVFNHQYSDKHFWTLGVLECVTALMWLALGLFWLILYL